MENSIENWQSAFVSSNGINIHYYRNQAQSKASKSKLKPTVLFIHGFSDNGLCWSRVARELEEEYDLLLLDSRGHGQSDKPSNGYTTENNAADVAGVIQSLQLGKVLIAGHSIGATTATAIAAHYPELIAAVVLEDPIWRAQDDPSNQLTADQRSAMAANVRKQLEQQQLMNAQQIQEKGQESCPEWHIDEFPAWVQAKQQVSPNVADNLQSHSNNWPELVAKFQSPVLLITGNNDKDVIVGPAVVAQAQSINPLIEHVNLSKAGHNIRRESFEEYVAALKHFLSVYVL